DSGIKPLVLHCVESAIRSLQCLKVCLIRRPEGTLTGWLSDCHGVEQLVHIAALSGLLDVVAIDDKVVVWRDRLASRHCPGAGVGFVYLAPQNDLEAWPPEFDPLS